MTRLRRCGLTTLAAAALLLAASMPCGAQTEPLTKEAKIQRILDLSNSEATVNQMFDQMSEMIMGQAKSQFPDATPEKLAELQAMQKKLLDLVRAHLSWEKMRSVYTRIYAETYTDDEINGLLAFYETPTGRAFIAKMPQLTQKIMGVMQTEMAGLMPEVQKLVQESVTGK